MSEASGYAEFHYFAVVIILLALVIAPIFHRSYEINRMKRYVPIRAIITGLRKPAFEDPRVFLHISYEVDGIPYASTIDSRSQTRVDFKVNDEIEIYVNPVDSSKSFIPSELSGHVERLAMSLANKWNRRGG
ncbi:hypothetical protein [Rhizobium herbae]|uniref:DUF3592 domain-containing protein n=1 Tax=Rhizobium herbae TaxID=508661 RepID=A0ABS4EJA3_9HYPH|nr:hypothetical protein [Rhizobium herbae]MBP1858025.1 hypothetical protein [Rhizobium herbae]